MKIIVKTKATELTEHKGFKVGDLAWSYYSPKGYVKIKRIHRNFDTGKEQVYVSFTNVASSRGILYTNPKKIYVREFSRISLHPAKPFLDRACEGYDKLRAMV